MYVLTADYRSKNAADVFVESLRNTGFAVISHPPIAAELIDATYNDWRNFFASSDKFDYAAIPPAQNGYYPFRTENAKYTKAKNLMEFFQYYPWSKFPSTLSKNTETLYKDMSVLAATLLAWIEELTPINIKSHFSMPLTSMIKDSPNTMIRIINYPPLQGDESPDEIRSAPHEDIDLLTLLPASTGPGLQVKDTQGRWHDVPAEHGSIVVNVGDMLEMCSQHYYKSTTHQVINPEGPNARKQRMSMPFFVHPHDEVRLSDQHTRLSYLTERLNEIGMGDKVTM